MAVFLFVAIGLAMDGGAPGKVVQEAFWLPGLDDALRRAPVVVRVRVQQADLTTVRLTELSQRHTSSGTLTIVERLRGLGEESTELSYQANWITGSHIGDGRLETEPWNFIVPVDGEDVLLIADRIGDDGIPHLHTFVTGTGFGYLRIQGPDDPLLSAIREYVRLLSIPRPAGQMALQQVAGAAIDAQELLPRLAVAHLLSTAGDGAWLLADRIGLAARYVVDVNQPLSFRLQILADTDRWSDVGLDTLAPLSEALLVLWNRVDDFVALRIEVLRRVAKLGPRLGDDPDWARRFIDALADPNKAQGDRDRARLFTVIDATGQRIQPAGNVGQLDALRRQALGKIR